MKDIKQFYTQQEYETAKNTDIVTHLQSIGYKLKKEGSYYKSELHNSLVINEDGRWFWNSKDIGGKSSVELLQQILINDYGEDPKTSFITAIKQLAGTNSINQSYVPQKKQKETKNPGEEKLVLPTKNSTMNRTLDYLCNQRCLDYDIVKDLIKQGKIYETKKNNNACFVSFDKDNEPKHAFLRGTYSQKSFKLDVENSDKNYAFSVTENKTATKLFCFESSVDAISHATLYKLNNKEYRNAFRIGLHGTSFLGLEQFLKDNPQIEEIVSCLDNDKTGQKRTKKMCEIFFEKGYKMSTQPSELKDYNEQLIAFVQQKNNVQEDGLEM